MEDDENWSDWLTDILDTGRRGPYATLKEKKITIERNAPSSSSLFCVDYHHSPCPFCVSIIFEWIVKKEEERSKGRSRCADEWLDMPSPQLSRHSTLVQQISKVFLIKKVIDKWLFNLVVAVLIIITLQLTSAAANAAAALPRRICKGLLSILEEEEKGGDETFFFSASCVCIKGGKKRSWEEEEEENHDSRGAVRCRHNRRRAAAEIFLNSPRFLASSIVDWQFKRFLTAGYSFPLEKNDGQYSVQQQQQWHIGIVVVRMRTVTRVAKSSLCISLSLSLHFRSSRFNCLCFCLSQCPLVGHHQYTDVYLL